MTNKKIFSLIAAVALTVSVSAQQSEYQNYVGLGFGGGLNTMLYQTTNGKHQIGGGFEGGLFYSRFFNDLVGLGVGLQYTNANASALYNYNEVTSGLTHPSNPNVTYNLNTGFNNWQEGQTFGLFSIPVEVLFRKAFNDRWAFIGGVGVSVDLPIHGSYAAKGGNYATTGVFPSLGNHTVSDMPEHGFTTYTSIPATKINNRAKVGVGVLADVGVHVALAEHWGLYMGIYGGYGVMNLLASAATDPMLVIDPANSANIEYHGTFDSNETNQANLLRAGVKVAVDFGWGIKEKKVEAEPEPVLEPAPAPVVDEEAERLAREKAEAERLAREQAEQERLAREQAEKERLAAEQAERDRLAREEAERRARWDDLKKRVENVNVYFENGGAEPNISDKDKQAVDELCAIMQEDKNLKVVVIGHTDNYGDPEQNLRYYGVKRAEVLKAYMVGKGVPADQISCESRGDKEPVAPNDTRANRALNRRANIRFL